MLLRYKLLAIDFDGTLLTPVGRVSPRSRQAIHRAKAAGLRICFATGRNLTESHSVLEQVDYFEESVFAGGAMVIDTSTGKTLRRSTMAPDLARRVCAFLEARDHVVLALQDTASAGVDYVIANTAPHRPLNPATENWLKITTSKVRQVPALGKYDHEHTVRVGIVDEPRQAQATKAQLDVEFQSSIVSHSLFVTAYGMEVVEVFDPAVDKWQGVRFVADRHGIAPDEIIAIGDDVNDLPMLESAGLGVAMGNAHPRAVAAARLQIGTNTHDGLAIFIEQILDGAIDLPPPEKRKNPAG
jgi:Cof subfamily protein (haloacid dehalogenase superfamily)